MTHRAGSPREEVEGVLEIFEGTVWGAARPDRLFWNDDVVTPQGEALSGPQCPYTRSLVRDDRRAGRDSSKSGPEFLEPVCQSSYEYRVYPRTRRCLCQAKYRVHPSCR